MINRLTPIILQKQREVSALQKSLQQFPDSPLALVWKGEHTPAGIKNFQLALSYAPKAIIAEVKRKSPSKGVLADIKDPCALANIYCENGANAISVLTDKNYFGGSLNDLYSIALALKQQPQAILRKDFIIDPIQIAEAVLAGADAVLCIVAILQDKTRLFLEYAKCLGISVLVEVHDRKELDIAIEAGAEIIGVNNRDLKTLEVDVQRAFQLLPHIPDSVIKVAESGISTPDLAQAYFSAGYQALLIGEALVKASHPGNFLQRCRYAQALY
jgi:indole-3-glycerol phosphate synthase